MKLDSIPRTTIVRSLALASFTVCLALGAGACERGPETQPPDGVGEGAEAGGSGGAAGGGAAVACEPAACTEKGLEAARVQDFGAALELFTKACDGGDAPGCHQLGEAYENGRGTDRDAGKAAAAYTAACDGGQGKACVQRGQLALAGDGPEPGPATAFGFFGKGCDAGQALACTTAAELAYSGNGVERDVDKAIALYEKACAAKEVVGCLNAGELLFDPNKDKAVNQRAVAAFAAACDGGHGTGCVKLGAAHYSGIGTAKDAGKALEAFKRACSAKRKDDDGCHVTKQLEAAKGKTVALELTSSIDRWDEDVPVRNLSCRMREQGPMALGEVMSGVGPVKGKLDACAAAGSALRVTWTFSKGRVREASVAKGGDDKLNKCVVKALKKAKIGQTGSCTANMLIGDLKAAEAALSKLQ